MAFAWLPLTSHHVAIATGSRDGLSGVGMRKQVALMPKEPSSRAFARVASAYASADHARGSEDDDVHLGCSCVCGHGVFPSVVGWVWETSQAVARAVLSPLTYCRSHGFVKVIT